MTGERVLAGTRRPVGRLAGDLLAFGALRALGPEDSVPSGATTSTWRR
ncbi:hypothetical protein [Kutzneria chonburiensis]|nr:hypothetical protein [Kutzneria chonburiensis]